MKNSDVIIFVYDITKEETFREIQSFWVPLVNRNCLNNPLLALVANNIDQIHKQKISIEEGKVYSEEIGAFFMPSSLDSNENINKLFENIGKTYLIKKQEEYKVKKNKCILI